MKSYTIGEGDEQHSFEGRKINEKILGTGPDDTKKITYYETLSGQFLKHVIHNYNLDESEHKHEISEVSSFEVP
ncbi:MAG: hypothetical protein ACLFN5_05930 [bacterium]